MTETLRALAVASAAAHAFNNDLVTVFGATERALALLPARHPARVELRDLMAAASRCASTAATLLDFGRRGHPGPVNASLEYLAGR